MRGLLGMAAASNLGVAVTTLAIRGWNSGGAHAAARNTARFSCLWCVAAFAAPGLARLGHGLPAGARLVQAFVAAHLVHFAVVAALIASFERAHLAAEARPVGCRAADRILAGGGLRNNRYASNLPPLHRGKPWDAVPDFPDILFCLRPQCG